MPQFEQICQQIRQAIEQGQLRAGQRLPTNRQFIEHLHVNHKTVQHAIAMLAKEGYVERWRGRGTFVQVPPRRGLVGLFVVAEALDANQHNFYGSMLRLLTSQLAAKGLNQRTYLGSDFPQAGVAVYRDIQSDLDAGYLAGFVAVVHKPPLEPILEAAMQRGVPVIGMTPHANAPYAVLGNARHLIEFAQRTLAEEGRHRTAYILNEHKLRHQSPETALSELGIPKAPAHPVVWQAPTMAGGYVAAADLPLDRIDSLIVDDDVMAMGVDRWLVEHRIDVPGRLQVVTHWNRGSRYELQLPFIRIENDMEEIASQVVGLLSQALAGHRIEQPRQHRNLHLVRPNGEATMADAAVRRHSTSLTSHP